MSFWSVLLLAVLESSQPLPCPRDAWQDRRLGECVSTAVVRNGQALDCTYLNALCRSDTGHSSPCWIELTCRPTSVDAEAE